ncbi:metal ABC transporter solute-binding protein, Zn/Mn family [Roseiterribacter gracilis]|uniref:Metal ABC transporter substrate-binding protein n=1 Tax=Roseiterribacter gracilis TaxID=2812848 RepID=A0A8S8X6R6_9PROT|nr:metal ABC transporter substrate-binding protein [Rhodospirillales bacterium TMPK1]
MRFLVCLLLVAFASMAQAAPLKLVASFTVLADLAREVGGEDVEVTSLVGPDSDAHGFEPSPSDARLLAAADLFVVNGLGFDPWAEKLAKSARFPGTLVTASDGVTVRMAADRPDPHAFQSVANARLYARNIANAVVAKLPARADAVRARAAAYDARLAALDADIRSTIETVPADRRVLITNHDAFGYFGAAYGLTLLAVQGLSTESEPSAKAVANLIREIRSRKARAVFLENMTNQNLMQRVARETGAAIGGALYADALSKPGGPATSYVEMMRYNARTVAAALVK